ncbi:hypothetical protein [Cohnella terricola]|uniref:Uncharacterized protein n=1 Tax=Cohnella terricola TaxID=1289167 RepID=A0A559JTU4_9BACL|nr:hypothetical protein [Cohnella terricola]TVY03306.1 hypothetical protein FPZ45_05380 [Cohnella terricola]
MNQYSNCIDEELIHLYKKTSSLISEKRAIRNSGIDSFSKQVIDDEISNHFNNVILMMKEISERDLPIASLIEGK